MRTHVDRWVLAARGAGASADDTDLAAAGEYLLTRWSEPQRQYHTVAHLTAVLDVIDEFAGLATDPDRVRLAAWLHDAVYDPRALGDANERDSAEFAEGLLATLGVPAATAAEVARLVGLTAGHATGEDDRDGELLCDADLAILASAPDDYAAYTAAIRREYAHVPDDAFRGGRAQVLKALLELPSIYRHPPLRAAWEDRARANLEAELKTLG
ncbi:metal-dependent phosphohydrolase [Amorphoplanes digitatis]|uniref:Putative metal-dependent HD superfamily phosphohydrolase n=1 Tax=Actinoplanes digitatis TaxID=1868 RepID=A0A7W7HRU2_9ACTN|nr:metal-dependent phosphohydrolase [Actinoplanes digitatis]MBB4759583.1 putative metal-dependent HD superfamily phosphohydrolase [Actinoplanes digitatis]